jgi:hypothetical protein
VRIIKIIQPGKRESLGKNGKRNRKAERHELLGEMLAELKESRKRMRKI